MKAGHLRTSAAVVGSVAGTVLGVALITGAAAYADDRPSPSEFDQPGVWDGASNVTGGQSGFYGDIAEDVHRTIYGDYPTVVGSYDTHDHDVTGFFFTQDTTQVIDSVGAAPAVGTVWDYSDFHTLIYYPDPALWPWAQNYYENDPATGFTQDLFSFNWQAFGTFENYFSSGPDGTLDEMIFLNQVIPIFDIPAAPASDLAGVGDPGDFSAMWSDLAALF